ncbi:MAG: xanthine dehydrogenase family protein molybdopterin-binding subunit [Woeseiaceae bacterium]|nr:xanthine dehydrogenase family protein molybdopterin-binding subunit [Woeseiaceae bacterium]
MNIERRDLLKGAAALVVRVALGPAAALVPTLSDARLATRSLNPAQLDTWLAVAANGDVTAYWGKMDMGQGVDTAIAQIIADELDIDVDRINVVSGDSALCADQGGASGSTGVNLSGAAFRAAAAEARLTLFEKAAEKLVAPVDTLSAADGVISVAGNNNRAVSYAELVSERMFDTAIEWNGRYGNRLALATRAKPKDPKDYRVVGTSVPRKDLPGKVLASTDYLHDLRVPGMLHGRTVRPPVAGARVRQVDKESVNDIDGVQVVVERDFVGVVAPSEWDAIRAARQLDVTWDESDTGFPTTSDDLFGWIRSATAKKSATELDDGDVDAAMKKAVRSLTAEYEWPFQSHARMAPAASVADVRDGEAVVWTDSQKPYDTGTGAKLLLETPINGRRLNRSNVEVRSIWMPGPGSYGRSDSGDGAMDAVVMSAAVGAPVRVQWMRNEGHAWDPKGPASVVTCRAGFDDSGDVAAYHFHIKGFSRADQNSREDAPGEVLAGHLLGHESTPEWTMQTPAESYRFANKRYSWEALAPLRRDASPLRTAHFRDPYGPEVHFAAESFIDEMAYANAVDPLEFRLRHVSDHRDADVLRAAADLAGWQPRTKPQRQRDSRGNYIGTGIAYARRNGSVNAVVAEVEVNPDNGRVWVRRMFVGADHGLVINPFGLDRVIEGNLLQATSRTLFEEVTFDRKMVTITDWLSYPILETPDVPLEIKIRQINRPDLGARGAGEPTTRVAPPAIANAFFDATGIRLRRVPLTRDRVKKALRKIS